MSSNTPNLALTKFTQGENFNNSILNANWEKVDAYVGTNSLGSGTISTIQDALLTLSTSMSAGQIAKIKFDISTASAPFGATGYVGYISKINSNRLCVNVRTAMYTTNEVVGNYKDGSWYWDVFALNSQITNLKGLSQANTGTTATDLNSCDYAGAYCFNSSTSNRPSGATYGICFVVATSEPQNTGLGWVFQLVFGTNDATKMYMRSRINNSTWSAWKSLTFA